MLKFIGNKWQCTSPACEEISAELSVKSKEVVKDGKRVGGAIFFLEFSESLKDNISFHYVYREKYGESAITLGNRV